MRSLPRLSVLELQQSRATGAFDRAEASIRRSLRASRDLQPRGMAVCQLVSVAVDGQVYDGIQRLTLTDPRLTADQVDRLLTLLQAHQQQSLNRTEEGLKVDYVTSVNTLRDLQSGRLTFEKLFEILGVSDGAPTSALNGYNYDAEQAACNQLYKLGIEAAAQPKYSSQHLTFYQQERERLLAATKRFQDLVAATQPADRPALRSRMPAYLFDLMAPPVESLVLADLRSKTQLAGIQTLLALRRYEIVHGRLPDDLPKAVAETSLKTVPIDPYSGQSLRYATVAGRSTVYSVGKDQKDDGGRTDWNQGTSAGDYLFPVPTIAP